MKTIKLERIARKIMMKTKGWSRFDMDDDFKDYPKCHRSELKWLIRELEKLLKRPRRSAK